MAFDFSPLMPEDVTHRTPAAPPPPAPVPPAPARPSRDCLLCSTPFVPAHRGAWVCATCRASDAWQQPVQFRGVVRAQMRRLGRTGRAMDGD
jgi:hypothetical protein